MFRGSNTMLQLCYIFLVLFYQHVQCHIDESHDEETPTPFHPPAPPMPDNARSRNCSTTSQIFRSQLPYSEKDSKFFCGNYWWDEWIYLSPYLRFTTKLTPRKDFQLRVRVKNFESETVGPYASNFYRGIWIAPETNTRDFEPGKDIPNGSYTINCINVHDCSFTAEPNTNIDIFIYFDDYAINRFSFVIEYV